MGDGARENATAPARLLGIRCSCPGSGRDAQTRGGPTDVSPAAETRPAGTAGLPRRARVRSALDAVRLLAASVTLLAVVGAAALATETAEGVAQDVEDVWARVPTLVAVVLDAGAVLAVLLLVLAVVVEHLLRRKLWALGSAFAAAVAGAAVAGGIGAWVTAGDSARLQQILDLGPGSVAVSVVVLVAFLSAGDLASTRWRVTAAAVVVAVSAPVVAVGGLTPVTAVVAILLGRVVGLATRLALGVETHTAPRDLVAAALERAGFDVVDLAARPSRLGVREFAATLADSRELEVVLADRDTQTTGLLVRTWRLVRFRSPLAGRPAWSPRGLVEREALATYAAAAAGVAVPGVRLLASVGPDALVLGRDARPGTALSDLDAAQVSDATLADAWRQLRRLHDARIAHRGLVGEAVRVVADGRVVLTGLQEATVAASDLLLRLDVAHLLAATAVVVGPDRAVAAARAAVAEDPVAVAGLLQPVALPRETRRRLDDGLLAALQRRLLPDSGEVAPPDGVAALERLRPRTVVTVVAAVAAAYVLATQIGSVDLLGALRRSDPRWLAVAVAASALTYLGAGIALVAFTPARVSLWRATAVQLAASFVTLVTPPAVGHVTLNLRFLRRAAVPAVAAATAVAVTQLASLLVTVLLLLGLGLVTGTSRGTSLLPSGGAIAVVAIVAVAIVGIALIPRVRRLLLERLVGPFRESLPRLLELARQPLRLTGGLAGNLLVTAAYVLALYACVRAVGVDLGATATAIAYLAGSAVGSAAPTPGGLGAVEAATVAALVAAGVPGSLALPAVLLFRAATFWLPVPPGWLAFALLQRRQAI